MIDMFSGRTAGAVDGRRGVAVSLAALGGTSLLIVPAGVPAH